MNKIIKSISIISFVAIPAISSVTCITSCTKERDLLDVYNEYCEKYQQDFIRKLSYTYHDYRSNETCTDFYCSSEAEAVFIWSHNAGYEVWNEEWHKGNNPLEMSGDKEAEGNVPDPNNPWQELQPKLHKKVRYSDCQYLDSALNHSKAGIKLTTYHGFEPNEYDLIEFLNNKLSTDIQNTPAEEFRKNVNLESIKNQSYINLGYCATSFVKEPALDWVRRSDDYETTPMLEFEIDPNVYCAYVSYTGRTYFDNYFLAWPREYQILVNRNAVIKVNSAEIMVKDNGKNILYLKCSILLQINGN